MTHDVDTIIRYHLAEQLAEVWATAVVWAEESVDDATMTPLAIEHYNAILDCQAALQETDDKIDEMKADHDDQPIANERSASITAQPDHEPELRRATFEAAGGATNKAGK